MLKTFSLVIAVSALSMAALVGCAGGRQWEITVENKSAVPCSVFVTLGADGSNQAKVENVGKGTAIILIAGNTPTIVQTVKVVREQNEQMLSPKTEIPLAKRFAIVIGADGKLETSLRNK